MNKIFTLIAFLFISVTLKAQIIAGQAKTSYYNNLSFNPAFAGEQSPFSLLAIFGNSINKGSIVPLQVEQTVVLDGQLANQGGLAFSYFRTTAGNLNRNSYNLSYSKGFDIGDEVHLKFGTNGGMESMPALIIGSTTSQRFAFNAGAGLLASYKGLVAGIAKADIVSSANYKSNAYLPKTTNFNLGYIYQNEEDAISLSGYVLILKDFQSKNQSVDFNFKTIFDDRLGLGIYARNLGNNKFFGTKGIIPYLDYKLSTSTNVGISYDAQLLNIENSTSINKGVFQLMLRYNNIAPDTKSKFVHY